MPATDPIAIALNETRAAAYREAANDLEADATRIGPSDPRAAEVLTAAAYLLRTRADHIAPPTT